MAVCASKVIRRNGFENKISLIHKRSTEIEVGVGKDMPIRANILITEVFDTELIGEGAIGTFNHAHECLLTVRITIWLNFIRNYFHHDLLC
jgi:protein arginine N-methyltransferase 7